MKLRRSYNHYYKRLKVKNYHKRLYQYGKRLGPRHYSAIWLVCVLIFFAYTPVGYVGVSLMRERPASPSPPVTRPGIGTVIGFLSIAPKKEAQTLGIITAKGTTASAAANGVVKGVDILTTPIKTHKSITTTVFWVGEAAGPENDYIPNSQSAWDGSWKNNYGGTDSPTQRNGYLPAGFTPKENSFYFALPYNDLDTNGNRKTNATLCPGSSSKAGLNYSWCKNTWIMIRVGSKTTYAQWEDVGPNEEDDPNYVFGTGSPKNTFDSRAGLDISPAARDYLGVGDISTTEWAFIDAKDVPAGPWKLKVTTTLGDSVN